MMSFQMHHHPQTEQDSIHTLNKYLYQIILYALIVYHMHLSPITCVV